MRSGVRRLRRRADLPARLDALARAADAADGRLPDELVAGARAVVDRAGERLRLSADHTVVALAGATGSGKSSLFNALAGLELARVGVRRPTTSEPLACVWGAEGAGPLLEWLGIPRRHQLSRESELDPESADRLGGLVLLDLPDHDSTQVSHRLEVDRLVRLVDLLVWVVDPQKYADAALHEHYLRPLASHADVTLVVLNQVDHLPPGEVERCVADLRRLLAEDGLDGVPVLVTSARTGRGVAELTAELGRTVAARRAAEDRLGGDVTDAAQALLAASGEGDPAGVGPRERRALVDALADAAGVPVVVRAVRRSHVARSRAATGWPVTRWLGRLRPDPLRRLRLDRRDVQPELVRSSLPAPTPVQRARADGAVRALADAAAAGAPASWVRRIREVAAASAERLPDRLDQALVGVDLGVGRRPAWWSLLGALQWVALAATLAGLGWLGVLWGLAWLRVPEPPTPEWRGWPVPTLLVAAGLLAALLVALAGRLAAAAGARRRAAVAGRGLREAVATAADEVVVEPVVAEVEALTRVREAARAALT